MEPVREFVIVGAGVSGLYCSLKLQTKYPSCKITVIEKLPRLGGRILTEKYEGHVMEYGPMRFEPELQKTFAKLICELKVPTKDFSPYNCSATPDLNNISFEEIQAIKKYAKLSPVFALLKYGLSRVLEDQWCVETDDMHNPGRDAVKEWIKKSGTFQGRFLHDHGLWDTLAHVLSKDAIDFMQSKGSFYHMLGLNPNAADQICFMMDILATSNNNLITLADGSTSLVNALVNALDPERVTVLKDTTVTSFYDLDQLSKVKVETTSGEFIADHVVFTCQQRAYERIKGFPLKIQDLFDTVVPLELFKIFAILENPPFDATTVPLANYRADRVPCREIHYSYDKVSGTGLVMIYGDMPYVNYWSPFIKGKSSTPHSNANAHLANHVAHYLRQIFDSASVPFSIVHYGIMDWSRDPYGAGCHLWRPGAVSKDVIQALSAFGPHRNVHICGEAFSNYQGFVEGCLRTVDTVVECIR